MQMSNLPRKTITMESCAAFFFPVCKMWKTSNGAKDWMSVSSRHIIVVINKSKWKNKRLKTNRQKGRTHIEYIFFLSFQCIFVFYSFLYSLFLNRFSGYFLNIFMTYICFCCFSWTMNISIRMQTKLL